MSLEDNILEKAVVFVLFLWNLMVGTHLETPYPAVLVEGYSIPLTRFFLLALTLISAAWSLEVGVFAALAFACLGADVTYFATP